MVKYRKLQRSIEWTRRNDTGHIRLDCQTSAACFCPITAVCYNELGLSFSNSQWMSAAFELALDHDNAVNIIRAADKSTRREFARMHEYHGTKYVKRIKALRRRLLAA